MIRWMAIALALSAAILAGCGGDDSSDDGPTFSYEKCNIDGRQQELGASYVTTIEVSGVSCADAEQVIISYHGCRQELGSAGARCDQEVRGFECTEGERQEVPGVQYNVTVECVKGNLAVRSNYTQNF